jgi:Xaa-Pro aminopeptidase
MDYPKRLKVLQEILKKHNAQAAFLTRRFIIGYYTGAFTPWTSALFVPVEGDPVIITFAVDVPRVSRENYYPVTLPYGGPVSQIQAMVGFLKEKKLDQSVIGFDLSQSEDFGTLSAYEYLQFREMLPDVKIEKIAEDIDSTLVIKTRDEIEALRRAAEAADLGVQTAYDQIEIGMTETEIAGWAELGLRRGGSTFNWCVTGTEIGVGYKQAYPMCFTTIPGNKRVQRGDFVTVDVHTQIDLYISDLALNCVVGKPTPAQEKFAGDWYKLVEHLLSQIKPGAVCGDIFASTWGTATQLGLDKITIPSFSHGLGVSARIAPTISPKNPFVLEENMTLEAIMQSAIPGVGGLRLEVPVLVTAQGCEVLAKTPIPLYVLD